MKVATWNVERLKHKDKIAEINSICNSLSADILVLTETDSALKPDCLHCAETPPAIEVIPGLYKKTENRVSIYTNYDIVRMKVIQEQGFNMTGIELQ